MPNPLSYTFSNNGLFYGGVTRKITAVVRPSSAMIMTDGKENQDYGAWIKIDSNDELLGYTLGC